MQRLLRPFFIWTHPCRSHAACTAGRRIQRVNRDLCNIYYLFAFLASLPAQLCRSGGRETIAVHDIPLCTLRETCRGEAVRRRGQTGRD